MHMPTSCPCGWKATASSDYLAHHCQVTRRLHPVLVPKILCGWCGAESAASEPAALSEPGGIWYRIVHQADCPELARVQGKATSP